MSSTTKASRPVWKPTARVAAAGQPFKYPLERACVEPDWRRFPGWRDVTREQWESALWQRQHTVKNLKELKEVMGALLPADLEAGIERDIRERATMSMLVPPQMINTRDRLPAQSPCRHRRLQ